MYFDDKNDEDIILRHFNVATLDGLGISDYKTAVVAAGALLNYLYETQKNSLDIFLKYIRIQSENI